jgi:hypothetical protein
VNWITMLLTKVHLRQRQYVQGSRDKLGSTRLFEVYVGAKSP